MKTRHLFRSAFLVSSIGVLAAAGLVNDGVQLDPLADKSSEIRVEVDPLADGWALDLIGNWNGACQEGFSFSGTAVVADGDRPMTMHLSFDDSAIRETNDAIQWTNDGLSVIEDRNGVVVGTGIRTSKDHVAEYLLFNLTGDAYVIRVTLGSDLTPEERAIRHRCIFTAIAGGMMMENEVIEADCASFSQCQSSANSRCGQDKICSFSHQGGENCHCRYSCQDAHGNCP